MRNPFRKRDRTEAALEDVKRKFGEMESHFKRLEESLARLNAKFPQVTVENVHIHQPVLEKLEFRLDALDIEQLSGSLNLGNNFGARLHAAGAKGGTGSRQEQKPKREPNGKPEPHPGPDVSGGMPNGLERTPSGFRLNNRR